ncbi:MAG: hypothetical protein IJ877_01055 [Candidatus Gastranaerophilales bacterium]|nr:hypothetical protein [Candidatus Gastranaerophilales bacterium]
MALEAISRVEPKRRSFPSLGLSAGVGAAVGTGLRYIVPTKAELASSDSFVSSAAMNARGASRSILKYGGIGALVALGIALVAKAFAPHQKQETNIEYTKLGALIDAPDYACEIMWYGE